MRRMLRVLAASSSGMNMQAPDAQLIESRSGLSRDHGGIPVSSGREANDLSRTGSRNGGDSLPAPLSAPPGTNLRTVERRGIERRAEDRRVRSIGYEGPERRRGIQRRRGFDRRELGEVRGAAATALLGSGFHKVKRIEDLVFGSLIFLATSPLMALIAIGVKLSSRGPVIFKQRRMGMDGTIMSIWKFRTMYVNCGDEVPLQAKNGDPRITPFGKILRRFSLDELPQFFQVLQGKMSIVGPRPHPLWLDEDFMREIQEYSYRYHVKPGITGWAQINSYRGATDSVTAMERRLSYDLFYITNWSLLFDIKIIFKTPLACLKGRNAY